MTFSNPNWGVLDEVYFTEHPNKVIEAEEPYTSCYIPPSIATPVSAGTPSRIIVLTIHPNVFATYPS
jgi:hypothetical protein